MTSALPLSISIVIPAFNEQSRLPRTLQALREFCAVERTEFLVREVWVIDDGSTDATGEVVKSLRLQWPLLRLWTLEQNRGKGCAVRAGFLQSTCDWILVADADMATPWDELLKFVSLSSEADLLMGSRALPQSQIEVRQHWLRQSLGKTFNRLLRTLNGLPFLDTQCGFKLIHNNEAFKTHILPRLQVDRFAWDVELILYFMKFDLRILEIPIRWRHQEQSRVHLVKDSLEMFTTILKLKRHLRRLS